MTKAQALDALMTISAMESWAYSQGKTLPDYLMHDVSELITALREIILRGEENKVEQSK